MGLCRPNIKFLTHFQTPNSKFLYPYSDQTLRSSVFVLLSPFSAKTIPFFRLIRQNVYHISDSISLQNHTHKATHTRMFFKGSTPSPQQMLHTSIKESEVTRFLYSMVDQPWLQKAMSPRRSSKLICPQPPDDSSTSLSLAV